MDTIKLKKYIRWTWLIILSPFLLFLLLTILLWTGAFGSLPSFEELENPHSNLASEVFSGDGKSMGKYYIENRSNVAYDQISPTVLNALVATEDVRFEEHFGVDYKATGRVIVKTIIGGDVSAGGGSTITQQLAKNLFPREANLNKLQLGMRKLQEWIIAIRLERNYTKDEIIAMYLNTVTYGHNAFGIKSASRTYFGKNASQLNQVEAAMLVGMLKGPSQYNPKRHPKAAKDRRNTVLEQMEKYNYLSHADCEKYKQLPIDLSKYKQDVYGDGIAPYFKEYLKKDLKEICKNLKKPDGSSYDLYKDGLRVYTTINSKMQKYAEEAVREHLSGLQKHFFSQCRGSRNAPFVGISKYQVEKILLGEMKKTERYQQYKKDGRTDRQIQYIFKNQLDSIEVFSWNGPKTMYMTYLDSIRYSQCFLQTGMMSMEPSTGFVKAWVGGIDNHFFKYDHVKQGKRQVGSTFKPFVYAVAMEQGGLSPCDPVSNAAFCMGGWCPKNSGGGSGGMVPLKKALAYSLNVVSARLIATYKYQNVLKLISRMGITNIPKHQQCPPLALGIAEIPVCNMVGALSTFVNKGVYIKPLYILRIEDRNGNIIKDFMPETQVAMSEQTAYLMVEIMKGVIEEGTAKRLIYEYGLKNDIAGKTGTTQNNSDGWFMGLTPNLVSGVWVGCESRAAHFRYTGLGQGASMALPIWGRYMKKVYNDKTLGVTQRPFDPPPTLTVDINCNTYRKKMDVQTAGGITTSTITNNVNAPSDNLNAGANTHFDDQGYPTGNGEDTLE